MHAIGALWHTLVRVPLLASVLQDSFSTHCSAAVRAVRIKLSALKFVKIASAAAGTRQRDETQQAA